MLPIKPRLCATLQGVLSSRGGGVRTWFLLLCVVVLGLVIYHNAWHAPFLIDDRMFLNDNHKNIDHLWGAFLAHPKDVYYRPLIHIVFKLMYYFFRENTTGYHAVNLILLIACALCVYALALRLWLARGVAFLAALFFMAHPINHILVNYSTTTCFSLQLLFMLCSLIVILKVRSDIQIKNLVGTQYLASPWSKVGSQSPLVFFLLALMCHESALVLPFIIFLLFYFHRRESLINTLKITMPFFVVMLMFMIFRFYYARLDAGVLHHYGLFQMNGWEYVASLTRLVTWYLSQLVFPQGVVPIWATAVVRDVGWWLGLASLGGVAVAVMMWRLRQGRGTVDYPVLMMLAAFIPLTAACLVEPTRGLVIEPYWLVIAPVGWAMVLAKAFQVLSQCLSSWRSYLSILAGVIVLLWGIVSIQYNQMWSSPLAYLLFWKHQAPGYTKVDCHLARESFVDKRYQLTREFYQGCFNEPAAMVEEVQSSLGLIELLAGNLDKAREHFMNVLRLNPRSLLMYTQLGVIAYQQHDDARAMELFKVALQDPAALMPRLNLATMYKKKGDMPAAINLYEEVLRIDPRNDVAFDALMRIYFTRQDKRKIKETAQRIVKYSTNALMVKEAERLWRSLP